MTDKGQVTPSAAEFYDEFFVPALFAQWAPRLVAAASLSPGMRVLDVACGTGVATIAAAEAVHPAGRAIGVDVNPSMLAVARRKVSHADWHEAAAEALPFDNEVFDAAVMQFGLMFFSDQTTALREMWRVLRPGGRMVVAVWASLAHAPGYAAATSLLERLFGGSAADLLRAPYSLGDAELLEALFAGAGVTGVRVQMMDGEASFPSIRRWMECDVRGWTLADAIDDAQFERLVAEAERELRDFVRPNGSISFPHPALFVTADKPGSATD